MSKLKDLINGCPMCSEDIIMAETVLNMFTFVCVNHHVTRMEVFNSIDDLPDLEED